MSKWGYWAYASVFTQNVGAATPIGLIISPQERMKLLHVSCGFGLVGAARAITLKHIDRLDNTILLLMSDSVDDNETIYGPAVRQHGGTVVADTPLAIGLLQEDHFIIPPDRLQLEGASIANAEVLTVTMRGLVLNEKLPAVDKIGLAPVISYNEVFPIEGE